MYVSRLDLATKALIASDRLERYMFIGFCGLRISIILLEKKACWAWKLTSNSFSGVVALTMIAFSVSVRDDGSIIELVSDTWIVTRNPSGEFKSYGARCRGGSSSCSLGR